MKATANPDADCPPLDWVVDMNSTTNCSLNRMESAGTASNDSRSLRVDGKSIREEKKRKWNIKHQRQGQEPQHTQQPHEHASQQQGPAPGMKRSKRYDETELSVSAQNRGVLVEEEEQNGWIAQHSNHVHIVPWDCVRDADRHSTPEILKTLLDPYWNLQDSPTSRQSRSLFVAEGTETVRLLLRQASEPSQYMGSIRIHSIFVKRSAFFPTPTSDGLIGDVEAACKKHHTASTVDEFPILLASDSEVLSQVAGFPIARGALACGYIPTHYTPQWLLHEYLPKCCQPLSNDGAGGAGVPRRLRLLALDGLSDTANLGSIVRSASAFGIHAILLSRDCCDPWYRRAVRVSMGHVFRVPCIRCSGNLELAHILQQLQEAFQVISYAAVVGDSDLILEQMERGSVDGSWCCVLGSEAKGISAPVADACAHRIRIDMVPGVDSLSVPIAAGILLHGIKDREASEKHCVPPPS